MKNTILARRYAKALFSIGKGNGQEESYSALLNELAALYAVDGTDLGETLTNPLYPVDARQKVMAKIAEAAGADQTMTSFLNLLVEKYRAGILPDIAHEYQVMLDLDKNISHGSVVSAVELSDELKEKIQATLEKLTGNKVILQAEVDPSIIGGIIAKVGDLVLDGSIKTQLNGLKESIKGRE